MAKVFLDANIFIDITEGRDKALAKVLEGNEVCVSTLSIGIWTYVYKRNVPDDKFAELFDTYNFVDCTVAIAKGSSFGPTEDFEDNVQLNSALDAGCGVFITKDKSLLKLGYFGKVRICESL